MSNVRNAVKIVVGIILLGISAFYLLGVCLVIGDAREDAAYNLVPYIEAEQTECVYLGQEPVINGEKQRAEDGYGFYQLTFRVENLSSVSYEGGLNYVLTIDRGFDQEVERIMECREIAGAGIYDAASPSLPGKTQVDLTYYVEVKEGVGQLLGTYRPNWNEDPVCLDIILD